MECGSKQGTQSRGSEGSEGAPCSPRGHRGMETQDQTLRLWGSDWQHQSGFPTLPLVRVGSCFNSAKAASVLQANTEF